ncbi:MAG: [FeFe] hydrogenase H-cluster radical SAM maturase HydE [Candidatus Omnitrophica bacterium]|nr:[FeFe] hydrogenase H-cluster radical SAM maturase HydE [Candidatus Omnitrophota bacterium]
MRKRILEGLKEELFIVLKEAEKVRQVFCGEEVYIRGIIEFSNWCARDCLYCGLRRSNKNIRRYRMKEEKIIEVALKIIQLGIKTIVLQSGDDFYYSPNSICKIIQKIKKKANVAITLSIGERSFDDYKAFRDAGADRYLLKHETANPFLYAYLHPGQSLKKRLKILEYLKKLGYQVGAGNIVGLPFQRQKDLVQDILLLEKLGVDMAGISPFIPQKDTPLKDFPPPKLDLALKVLALARIITKNAHLPATTAFATLDSYRGQLLALKAGANVIMPDFTPSEFSKDYKIYDGKLKVNFSYAEEIISKAKRKISLARGDSLKKEEKCIIKEHLGV